MSKRERLNENFLALLKELGKKGVIKGPDYLVVLPKAVGVPPSQLVAYLERTKHITFHQAISFCEAYEIPEKKMFLGIPNYGSEIAKENIPDAFGGPIIPSDPAPSIEFIRAPTLPGEQQFRVIGMSMEPNYFEGKIVVGKKLEKPSEIRNGLVHIIENREGLRIKRLQKVKGSHYKLISDNKSYYEDSINFDDYPESKIYEVRPQEGIQAMKNNGLSIKEKQFKVNQMLGNNQIETVCEILMKYLDEHDNVPSVIYILRDFKVIQQAFQKKAMKKEKKDEEEVKVVDRLFSFLKDLNDKDWDKLEIE
ncbi:MAG: helix-turn-helix transcriptional regulator [Saprospiraceae bacterium]